MAKYKIWQAEDGVYIDPNDIDPAEFEEREAGSTHEAAKSYAEELEGEEPDYLEEDECFLFYVTVSNQRGVWLSVFPRWAREYRIEEGKTGK